MNYKWIWMELQESFPFYASLKQFSQTERVFNEKTGNIEIKI